PSVPSRDIRSANRTAVLLTNPNRKLRGPALSPTPTGPNHPLRRDELHPLAGHHHLPPAFVDQPVVMPAKRNHLAQVGLPALGPELDVVGVGPADRRSQPGQAQVLCRAFRPRHCAGCAVRLARPTSMTLESALSTRCRVPSQA